MKVVTLVSGGLDSTVMAKLVRDEGIEQIPVFINYGQRNLLMERAACERNMGRLGLGPPTVFELPGYGATLPSGLTDPSKHIVDQVFLPGRNMLFLLCAAGVAQQKGAGSIAIGFLNEAFSLFPDQRRDFVDKAQDILSAVMMTPIRILTPLISMTKADVVAIAADMGIKGTYSCHAGTGVPCRNCVACREYDGIGGGYGR